MITLHLQSGERTHAGAGLDSFPVHSRSMQQQCLLSQPTPHTGEPELSPCRGSAGAAVMRPPHLGGTSPPGGITVFITGCCVPKAFHGVFLPFLCVLIWRDLLWRRSCCSDLLAAHHLTDLCSLFRAACGFFFIRNKVLLCSPG